MIEVRHRDVVRFAKKQCRDCFGKGEVTFLSQAKDSRGRLVPGGKAKDTPKVAKLCGCAWRRFRKVQKVNINAFTGAVYFMEPIVAMTEETRKEYENDSAI